MGTQNKEVLAALETAIQLEVEGHSFYAKTAERVSWPEGKKMFVDLAKDEMEHIRILKEQHASLMEGHDWLTAEKVAPQIASGAKKHLPVFETNDAVIAGMVDDQADALEAMDVAIKAEYKSHTFYAQQSAATGSPEAKKIWDWLVGEEKTHQAILMDYSKYIGAQQEWLLVHERPILEG